MNRLIINDKGNKASVPIEISAKRTYTSVSINNKNKYMELSLEDLMSRRFMISADTSIAQLQLGGIHFIRPLGTDLQKY